MAQEKRDGFQSRSGFILACIGSAVGMGNIWRFPVMVSTYGGLTFLIPFFIFVILIASTGVIEEFALGRAAGAGPVGAFGMATKKRFRNSRIGEIIGFIPVLGALGMAIGYTSVKAWTFKYACMSVTGDLYAMGQDTQLIEDTFNQTAGPFGANIWIVIVLIVVFCIMFMGIAKGVEIANKIMIPTLFGLFIILAIYMAFLPGSEGGYDYLMTLKPEGLADPDVWIFAFGQAFFSLSVAGNGSVIYGSYLSKKESIPRCAIVVALFDVFSAIMATLVILPAMACVGVELTKGGPGLMFIYLVQVMNAMPGGRFIAIIFFVAIVFAGLGSIVNMYETPIAVLQERFNANRKIATIIILVVGGVTAIFVQQLTAQWMDVMSIYVCPLGAALAGIMFFWLCGKKFVEKQVALGTNKKRINPLYYPLGKYVYCSLAVLVLVLGILKGGIG